MRLVPGVSEVTMSRKNFFALILAAAVFSLAGSSVSAQNAPVRGEVKLKKADGTVVPVADAIVDAYRTDTERGKMPEAKTNKRGEFNFVGFPLGQKFVLAVSGPGIGPRIQPDVKAGMERIVFVVDEGDGRRLSEAEAREAAKLAAEVPATGMTESQKESARKQREDFEKKNAEIKARNEKIQAADEIASRADAEGKAALREKNWELAIAKFSEGIAAVPDYVGSTPVLILGKITALKNRGFDIYVQGAKSPDVNVRLERYAAAKKEYNDALAGYAQAADVLKKAEPATDAKDQQFRKAVANDLYTTAIEVHRLMAVGQVDTSRVAEAEAVIKEYQSFETDPAKKSAALTTLGDIMRYAGDFEKAVAAYKTVLETTPENTEVMASLGLSLVAQGTSVDPPNRDQLQEGLNYMQKYADTVAISPSDPPAVQEFKQSVKDTVEYLKTEQKLKAQPTKAAPRKKG
jgi:tetratricopeptide (TPR) repeat protein